MAHLPTMAVNRPAIHQTPTPLTPVAIHLLAHLTSSRQGQMRTNNIITALNLPTTTRKNLELQSTTPPLTVPPDNNFRSQQVNHFHQPSNDSSSSSSSTTNSNRTSKNIHPPPTPTTMLPALRTRSLKPPRRITLPQFLPGLQSRHIPL